MKIDLDELKRVAHGTLADRRTNRALEIDKRDAEITIALITRICELEEELIHCAAYLEPPQADLQIGRLMRADAAIEARALVAKGTTR